MRRNDPLYPYAFINKSGETMPAYSIMKLDSSGSVTVNKRLFTGVTKPDTNSGLYLINGPIDVADDEYGHATSPLLPCWVKYSGTAPSQGDLVGPSDDAWTVATDVDEELFYVWHVDATNELVYVQSPGGGGPCPYYWEIYIENGSDPPSSGSSIFAVTLDSDEQDVTIDYDMTAAELSSELLSEFTALEADDIEVTGGPLPVFPLYVQWKRDFVGHASEDYPPTAGTNTLNNSSQMKIRQINPRA